MSEARRMIISQDPVLKDALLHMLATYKTTRQIQDWIFKQTGYRPGSGLIGYYKAQFREEIAHRRDMLDEKLSQIAVSHRYYRLELLQRLINNLMQEKNLWSEEPIYDKKNNIVGHKRKANHYTVAKLIEQARIEMSQLDNFDNPHPVINFNTATKTEKINYIFTGDPRKKPPHEAMKFIPKDVQGIIDTLAAPKKEEIPDLTFPVYGNGKSNGNAGGEPEAPKDQDHEDGDDKKLDNDDEDFLTIL